MKYQVNYTGANGATSAMDTIEAEPGYTAEQYVADCEKNADADYVEMLHDGEVKLIELD